MDQGPNPEDCLFLKHFYWYTATLLCLPTGYGSSQAKTEVELSRQPTEPEVSTLLWSDSFATLQTVARQAPPSMGLSRQKVLEWVAIFFSMGSS